MKITSHLLLSKTLLCIYALTLAGTLSAQVTTSAFQPNTGARAHWTIKVQPKTTPTSVQVTEKEVKKVPDKRCETTAWSDGRKDVNWFYQDLFMQEARHYPEGSIQIYRMTNDTPERADFPELAWALNKPLVKTTQFSGRKAWILTKDNSADAGPSPVPSQPTLWVSIETGLPMAYDDGAQIQTYSFLSPPADLTLPKAYQDKAEWLEKMDEKARIRSTQRPG
jgi:hypothetical protein